MKLTHAPFRCAAAGALAFLFCVPAANAMVASVYDSKTDTATALHNTSIPDGYSALNEIWNRTVYFGNATSGGTGTYLGRAKDGSHLVLTAKHVSFDKSNVSVSTTSGKNLQLIATKNWQIGTGDLQIHAVSADETTSAYLDELGNIEIYDKTPENTQPLFCVGTGKSSEIGSAFTSGTREKQWAVFARDSISDENGNVMPTIDVKESGVTTTCFVEILTKNGTSMQATQYDSGSGVFVWDSSENKWKIAGVTLAVGSNTDIDTSIIGYYEESGKDSPKTCCTFFADLSQYAPQINAIMAIPEPSAFSLLAGTCALVLAASRRRRSRPLPLR